jgi:hypothetical protein
MWLDWIHVTALQGITPVYRTASRNFFSVTVLWSSAMHLSWVVPYSVYLVAALSCVRDMAVGYSVFRSLLISALTFWHRSFTFNSNKSPTWCNNFSVYYPDVCLQLNVFRAFSRPSSEARWLQWQLLVLHSYRRDSSAVFVVGPTGPTTNTARLAPR